jgi:hypothetical protein
MIDGALPDMFDETLPRPIQVPQSHSAPVDLPELVVI